MERWRHSLRRTKDPDAWVRAWAWMKRPDDVQRAACARGACPVGRHAKKCPALHHRDGQVSRTEQMVVQIEGERA